MDPSRFERIVHRSHLQSEDETTVSTASSWVLEARAAEAIVNEKTAADRTSGK
jgi:hypothetical protein